MLQNCCTKLIYLFNGALYIVWKFKYMLIHCIHFFQLLWCKMPKTREYQRGKYHCTVDLLFDWFQISYMTTDNFCFYLQNRLIQTSQTGGQRYSVTSPFSIPCLKLTATLSRVGRNHTKYTSKMRSIVPRISSANH